MKWANANRLKIVLSGVVFESWNAFVKGRLAVFIANECQDNKLKMGMPGVLCSYIWKTYMIMLTGISTFICCKAVVLVKCEGGLLDCFLNLHHPLFCFSEWWLAWFLPKLLRVETGQSIISFIIYNCYGGFE